MLTFLGAMSFTEETLLAFLLERGGRVEYSVLLNRFRPFLDTSDPAEKEQNRELFKRCVNSVAFIKQFEGARYIVIKKQYLHLLTQSHTPVSEKGESEDRSSTQNISSLPESASEQREDDHSQREGGETQGFDSKQAITLWSDHLTEDDSQPTRQLVLRRRKEIKEEIVHASIETSQSHPGAARRPIVQKPYMLPLRMPPVQTGTTTPKPNAEEERLKKVDADQNLCGLPENNRELKVLNTHSSCVVKGFRSSVRTSELRDSGTVPLQSIEHEWLVTTALGHWTRVHSLLLQDAQLAEMRDFTSGFTALHWAAKNGHCETIEKILEISKRGGREVDVNRKAYGGYTPLHVAAIHGHKAAVTLLMSRGANGNLRDNSGKKACHYLRDGASREEMLAGPADPGQGKTRERTEVDSHFDLAAGFNTISRLFQPHVTGHKRKQKQTEWYTASDDPSND